MNSHLKFGNLERIEILDPCGTRLYNLPDEIEKLKHLKLLRVSFYGADDDSDYRYLAHASHSYGIISKLLVLQSLTIVVQPVDWRRKNNAEAVVQDVRCLSELTYLQFCFPEIKFLELFIQKSLSWKACPIGMFRFVIGKEVKRLTIEKKIFGGMALSSNTVHFNFNERYNVTFLNTIFAHTR